MSYIEGRSFGQSQTRPGAKAGLERTASRTQVLSKGSYDSSWKEIRFRSNGSRIITSSSVSLTKLVLSGVIAG